MCVLLFLYPRRCYSITGLQRMHTTRSPSSIPTGVSGDALDLSLSGSQLSMSKRPSSASPGKYFSRSVSVSVAGDSRGKRNTLVSNRTVPHLSLCGGDRLELEIVTIWVTIWTNQQGSSWYHICESKIIIPTFCIHRAMPAMVVPDPSRTWGGRTAPLRLISRQTSV